MATEHATVMVLKVDLECSSCFLKVKKVLAQFPQIGDQVFDWKENEVRISVICCDPQKIRHKLCSKAGKAIKSIDIKEPAKTKPKDADKPKTVEKPKDTDKPKTVEKPKVADKPKTAEKPKEVKKPNPVEKKSEKPKIDTGKSDKSKKDEKTVKPVTKPTKADPSKAPEPAQKPSATSVPQPMKMPGLANGYPLQVYPPAVPMAAYNGQFYDSYGGGPGHHGYGPYGRPIPQSNGPFGYDNNMGFNVKSLEYFSEENSTGCSIM